MNNNFFKNKKVFFFLLLFSLFLSLFVNFNILRNNYSNSLVFFWLFSILFLLVSLEDNKNFDNKIKKDQLSKTLLIVFFIILPSLVRILMFDLTRIHGDDLLSSYFSAHYNFKNDNFFAPIPQDKVEWVCQFPSLYFVIQKLFFSVFGESLLTIKLSVIPYVLIVSLMLFLIVRQIFNWKLALISLLVYSFFWPSLYLETLGLHFISSTAVFLIFFYFLLRELKTEKLTFTASLLGISCGFCFLFYSSSYIAIPLLFFAFIFLLVKNRKSLSKKIFFWIIGFLVTASPFITYMYKIKSFYLSGRLNQVSLINGSWSTTEDRLKNGESLPKIVQGNFLLSLRSLYKDGIGGHGGYNFGNLSLFGQYSLILLILGSFFSIYYLFKKIEIFFIFLTIFISFITGMVLTIPPPPFHRFSIAFPFLSLLIGVSFYPMLIPKKPSGWIRVVTIIVFLAFFFGNNLSYFQKATEKERNNQLLQLADYVSSKYSDRNIYIAAFPGFALDRIFYFAFRGNRQNKVLESSSEQNRPLETKPLVIQTEYHGTFLENFNRNEKYLYIIIFPWDFNQQFQEADKNGSLTEFSKDYSLFAN